MNSAEAATFPRITPAPISLSNTPEFPKYNENDYTLNTLQFPRYNKNYYKLNMRDFPEYNQNYYINR